MAKSVSSNATPEMLRWARVQAGFSVDDVAAAEGFHPMTIDEWEEGIELPTFAQLERLAKRYKRPTMVFYLPAPPTNFNVVKVKDYRMLLGTKRGTFTPDAAYAIRSIQEKQAWAAEFLSDDQAPKRSFVGRFSLEDEPAEVGKELRAILGMTIAEQVTAGSAGDAYRGWRGACENVGVLVFTFTGIPLEEMRGFAICDEFAPAVAISSKDPEKSRVFSLLHECVHLLVGDTGVSSRSRLAVSEYEIERFCESAAAEALMPMEDFDRRVPASWRSDEATTIAELSRRYWCSKSAVIYRLADAGRMGLSEAHERVQSMQLVHASPKKPVKIPPATRALSKNGRYFSRLAISAYRSGDIHGGQLTSLLGMKIKHMPALESKLSPLQMHSPAEARQ